jgi:hypothetical protein
LRNFDSAAKPLSQRSAWDLLELDATARLGCADIKVNFIWFRRYEKTA